MRRDESGQASIEWIALLLLVALAALAMLAFVPARDGRPLGAALARALVCAVKGDCGADGAALQRAYGARDAELVRANAPNIAYEPGTFTLPVDYRRCRSHRCSDAPDDRNLDVHRSARGGVPATAFTHVVHRYGRTYIQYWFYYPDSPSTFFYRHALYKKLGLHDNAFHPDDWEGYQVRIGRHGTTSARATRHKHYSWCKGDTWGNIDVLGLRIQDGCDHWGPSNGWTRVSRGSHAGYIPKRTPGNGTHERSTMGSGLHLVPLETLDETGYRSLKGGEVAAPPWRKGVYVYPESDSS